MTTEPNGLQLRTHESQNVLIDSTLEADISEINALLSRETLSTDDDAHVIELLQRLESADGLAQGVEERLDGILDKLDGLINVIGSQDEGSATLGEGPLPVEDKGGSKAETLPSSE